MCASAVRVPADSAIPIDSRHTAHRARPAGVPAAARVTRAGRRPFLYRTGAIPECAKTDDKSGNADRRIPAPTRVCRVLRYSPTLARGNHSAVDLDSAPETCAARTRLREPYVRTSRMRYAATRITRRDCSRIRGRRGSRAGQPRPYCAALGSSAQATARMPLTLSSKIASSSVSRCRLHSPPPPWPYS